eukprot:TRINITY_DN123298_c0_g1_i1.p3 TRINITY_DN123298_c0_g1~~TRINITY_DN123298_c0_g1_i1.p3  ORF type:complete len:109 (-),score=0.38 TRINITY_DN123298_c0_g1_i1:87-413(-)
MAELQQCLMLPSHPTVPLESCKSVWSMILVLGMHRPAVHRLGCHKCCLASLNCGALTKPAEKRGRQLGLENSSPHRRLKSYAQVYVNECNRISLPQTQCAASIAGVCT